MLDKGPAPELIPDKTPEWGREVKELKTCAWEDRTKNPGYEIEAVGPVIQHNPGVEGTMKEYNAGSLKSGSGAKVKSRKQAIAIGLSEQRKGK
jgi:hypothetical protein